MSLDKLKSIAEKSGREFSVAELLTGELSIFKQHRLGLTKFTEKEITETLRSALKVAIAQLEQLDWVTCVNCGANENCPYAFDPYNTGGDCLAEK